MKKAVLLLGLLSLIFSSCQKNQDFKGEVFVLFKEGSYKEGENANQIPFYAKRIWFKKDHSGLVRIERPMKIYEFSFEEESDFKEKDSNTEVESKQEKKYDIKEVRFKWEYNRERGWIVVRFTNYPETIYMSYKDGILKMENVILQWEKTARWVNIEKIIGKRPQKYASFSTVNGYPNGKLKNKNVIIYSYPVKDEIFVLDSFSGNAQFDVKGEANEWYKIKWEEDNILIDAWISKKNVEILN